MLKISGAISIQLSAALLLIFWGWGFSNLPHFFANWARAFFVLVIIASGVLAIKLRVQMQPLRRGVLPTGAQGVELVILLALSLSLLWFLPFADRQGILKVHSSLIRDTGVSLCVIGGFVRISALRRLGNQFSAFVTLQPGHRLVRDGIYSHLRHPLYLSLLLVPTGIAMVFANLLALPIFIFATLFVTDRIRKEEKLLAATFGQQFAEYQRRTKLLIPCLF
jgi:protein-S-isoprenylcysteine O-methyltransferase Ste14